MAAGSRSLVRSLRPSLRAVFATTTTTTTRAASGAGAATRDAFFAPAGPRARRLPRPLPRLLSSSSPARKGPEPGNQVWSFEQVRRLAEASQARGDAAKEVLLIDVREPDELQATGKIPGAINIPLASVGESLGLSEDEFARVHGVARPTAASTLVFYCKAGVRARSAAALARQAGWETVGEYTGSWLDWEAHGGPVQSVESQAGRGS